MTDNPYYEILRIIRTQGGQHSAQPLTAVLERIENGLPVFSAEGQVFHPEYRAEGLMLTKDQVGGLFLCLRLNDGYLALCRLV